MDVVYTYLLTRENQKRESEYNPFQVLGLLKFFNSM